MFYQNLGLSSARHVLCVALSVLSSEALLIGDKVDVKISEAGEVLPVSNYLWLQTLAIIILVASLVGYVFWQSNRRPSAEIDKNKVNASLVSSGDLADHRCLAAAFTLGVLNNITYAIVVGSSQNMAKEFGTEDLMALFSTVTMSSCLCATLLNSSLCLKLTLNVRVRILLFFSAAAYVVLSIATCMSGVKGFLTALFGCVLVGTAQVIGELGNLAFFKLFPPSVLGAWGAGTGIAGVSGTGLYLLLRAKDISNSHIFVMLLPTTFFYYVAFQYLNYRAKQCGLSTESNGAKPVPVPLSMSTVLRTFRCSADVICNFAAVYFLEYSIVPGLFDRETLCPLNNSFLASHAYTFMLAGGAVGLTLSRSSISFFQTDRIWIFTVLVAVNFCLWFSDALTHTVLQNFGHLGYIVLIIWAFECALLGGACYANSMYAFNTRQGIPEDVRELSINIAFVLSNVGTITSTSLSTVLHNTIMSSAVLYPNGCPSPTTA